MKRCSLVGVWTLVVLGFVQPLAAAPTAKETVVLGPFTGPPAPLHPENAKASYYGTDLGWSYLHAGRIQFLFGDTIATEKGDTIDPAHDDMFGSIDLAEWKDSTRIERGTIPLLKLVQIAGTRKLAGLDPGIPMETLKTPLGGFSNGSREFGVFITGKPQGCHADAECSNGLTCDAGLGYVFERYDKPEGLTFPCVDGAAGCTADTVSGVAGSGFCVDRSSTITGSSEFGRVGSYGIRQVIGVRSTRDPAVYADTKEWLTNKFTNVAVRADTRSRRVLLWGRPGFVGVNAKGSTLGLYFAYVEMPGDAGLTWRPHYFTGLDSSGAPRFSANERDAVPLDLDSSRAGIQAQESHDLVQQMSVVWIDHLKKWVMFYGGGISELPIPGFGPNCGILEVFARRECKSVVVGNGALRMRTADNAWGPWNPPQDLLVGGVAEHRPLEGQYAPGGILHHPACVGAGVNSSTPSRPAIEGCIAPSAYMPQGDYGWLYGANIIEEWTRPVGAGVEVIWNVSTWDPYRVVLLKTRIDP